MARKREQSKEDWGGKGKGREEGRGGVRGWLVSLERRGEKRRDRVTDREEERVERD